MDRASDWTGILFGLCVALLAAFQQLKMPPVLPEMLDRYDYGTELAGGFMSIFAVIGLTASVRIGRAMQRQSCARWLLGGCVLILVGAIPILVFPSNGWAVLLGRGLEGLAMTILAVAGPSLMVCNASQRHLPIAAALAATWIPLGGLIATIVARAGQTVPLMEGSWPWVWWIGLGFAGGMAAWTMVLSRQKNTRLSLPTAHDGSPGLTAAERRAMLLLAVCFSFWALQNITVWSWLPEYLVGDRGISDAAAKELYGMTVITVALSNLLTVAILRLGISMPVLLILALLGQVALLALGPLAPTVWQAAPILICYGVLAGITPVCLFGMPGVILGSRGTGSAAFGMIMAGRNLGVLCGPLLVGWIAAGGLASLFGGNGDGGGGFGGDSWAPSGWTLGWWAAALSTLIAFFLALILNHFRKTDQGTSL